MSDTPRLFSNATGREIDMPAEIVRLERELATARADALEEAARICDVYRSAYPRGATICSDAIRTAAAKDKK